jgi:hypothetical protein
MNTEDGMVWPRTFSNLTDERGYEHNAHCHPVWHLREYGVGLQKETVADLQRKTPIEDAHKRHEKETSDLEE